MFEAALQNEAYDIKTMRGVRQETFGKEATDMAKREDEIILVKEEAAP